MTRTSIPQRERSVLKLGATLAIAGGLGYLITSLVHGDLPDETVSMALDHIAARPEWRFLKLAFITCAFAWIGAFMALARSLSAGSSWLLSRLAVAVVAVGTTVIVVEYSIIGHALKEVADAWQKAPDADNESLLLIADTMLSISGGLFHSFVAWLIGLPFLLMGGAVSLDRLYPQWTGWVAIVAGTGALVAGTTRFLGFALVPYPLLFGGFVFPLNLWLAGMGLLMWRRASLQPS